MPRGLVLTGTTSEVTRTGPGHLAVNETDPAVVARVASDDDPSVRIAAPAAKATARDANVKSNV